MNPHILFVIDHSVNTGKYSKEELEANYEAARTGWASDAKASRASRAAYYAAYYAADSAADSAAIYWVDEYFESTGEDKQTYIDKLGG
jgi:hypothetical protein